MRGRRLPAAVILILSLTPVLTGCASAPRAAAPAASPPELFDPAALETAEPAPAWSHRYPRSVAAAVLPDGSGVLVAGPIGPGGQPHVELLDAGGARRWRYPVAAAPDARLEIAAVEPRADRAVVLAAPEGGRGVLLALTLAGRPVWRYEVGTPASVRLSPDGRRAAVVDHAAGRLALLGDHGAELAALPVGPGAVAEFVAGGALVVDDQDRVVVVGPDGQVLRRLAVDEGVRRQLAVLPDGRRVVVAASGGHDALYLLEFDPERRRVWSPADPLPLYPGGRNRLRLSPDGETAYVHDVGDRGGLYAVATRDLSVRWRLFTRGPGWTLPELAAGEGRLLARYARGGDEPAEHWVRVHPSGKPAVRLQLDAGARWLVPSAADGLLVALRPMRDGQAVQLRAYRLPPLTSAP